MHCKTRRWFTLGSGICFVAGLLIFREPLTRWVSDKTLLANPAPPPELVEAMIDDSPDHEAAIVAAWNTGKIVHKQAAVAKIAADKAVSRPLSPRLESIVLSGALDVDNDIREICLGILHERHDPALASLAVAQLQDCDPQVRLLGLNALNYLDPAIGVPSVIPVLNDSSPMVVARGLKLLGRWSGKNFGVKVRDTLPFEDDQTGLMRYPEGSAGKVAAGVALARAWWNEHQSEFPPVHLVLPSEVSAGLQAVPAEGFSLRDLDGRTVRLSDFRGKTVLINFWTTWCTACVSEMPDLIALQKEHKGQLAIVGVSLDFVPDDDGDSPSNGSPEKIMTKIVDTVKSRGINYPILADEKNEVGGEFNGGELPTTVIVDGDGNIRRRFIGARELPVFEAMIAEANKPLSAMRDTSLAKQ